ncbi:hypothetical protein BGZ59_008518 [Podila verticillata]|nr:hypothetical protein BGZ59_008518 [Podila verticillata]
MTMANSPITQATEHPASSSPPSSSSESPITQVSQYPPNRHHTHRQGQHGYGGFPSTLYLDLRGTRFEIERDVLVSLPESILIVMFPNGLILGQPPARTRQHLSPPQQQPQQQAQQPQLQQEPQLQQQMPSRPRQPADQQQQPPLPSSSSPNQTTLQQEQLQTPTPSQGQDSSPSQHHRRQSSSDSSYYDDEDYDDDYDDDYYDDEDEEGEDEEYESEDEEEYMSMEDQVIHVDFDPSCMAFLLNVYRQAQQAGEAHRQQQIQLMLQKQRLAQAQAQAQEQAQQPQQKQQLFVQDLARAQPLSQSQAQSQAHAQNHSNKSDNKSNSNHAIDNHANSVAVDQQAQTALDPTTAFDASTSPANNDAPNATKTTVVSGTEAGTGTETIVGVAHNPSSPPASSAAMSPAASSLPSSTMITSTSTSTSASISHSTATAQPRSSTTAQQQQNELHQLQQQQIYQNSSSSPSSSSSSSSAASSRSNLASLATTPASNPLLNKQAIIVLREELDYFAITPPKTGFPAKDDLLATGPVLTDLTGFKVKTACGQYLLEQSKIFTALQRNISKENNVAEQHLIDMLCVSGFSKDDEWGYRRMETGRTSIASLSLVMLKTAGDGNQMATAQKLLLFWRKPARKCWWDGVQIELDHNGDKVPVRLWARRTWTLELVLV